METIRRTLFPSSYCPLLISAQIYCCLPSCSFAWNTCSLRKGQSLHCVLWPSLILRKFAPAILAFLWHQLPISTWLFSLAYMQAILTFILKVLLTLRLCSSQCSTFLLVSNVPVPILPQTHSHQASATPVLPKLFLLRPSMIFMLLNPVTTYSSSTYLSTASKIVDYSLNTSRLFCDTCSWFSSPHNGHLVCLLCWPSFRPTLLTSLYLQHSSL